MESEKSVEQLFQIMSRKSILLNPDRAKAGRPQCSAGGIIGISGIKNYLADIMSKDFDLAGGGPTGHLESAKMVLTTELANFKANHRADKNAKPEGKTLEQINTAKAMIMLLEAESRFCNKVIAEHEASQAKLNQDTPMRNRGVVKRDDKGVITSCDQRRVDVHGKFVDNGEDVYKYIDEVLEYRKAQAARAKAQAREQRYQDVMPAL